MGTVMNWRVALIGGPFDGEIREMRGDPQPELAPAAVWAFRCPCCDKCAVPAPGTGPDLELRASGVKPVGYRLIRVLPDARAAMYEFDADGDVSAALAAVTAGAEELLGQ